jgi:hypothetical protein
MIIESALPYEMTYELWAVVPGEWAVGVGEEMRAATASEMPKMGQGRN